MCVVAGRRFVFVVAGGILGGAEREALDIALHLHRNCRAEVIFCALHGSAGPLRAAARREGLSWHVVDAQWSRNRSKNAMVVARVAARLRALRPDVLLPFTNKPNVLCGLTWRTAGAALCVWNQRDVDPTRVFRQSTFRRALRGCPLVTSGAHHAAEWLVRYWNADPSCLHVTYCSSELPLPRLTRIQWRESLEVRSEDLLACMVAHLKPGKDQTTVIAAWRTVVDRGDASRRATLVLAGDDLGTRATLESQVQALGLTDHVRFLGGVDDIAGLLDACDVGVFCSEHEMLPHGVIEPMSRGLPVVGNDIPGIREALGPGAPRWLTPTRDPGQLAELILELDRDERLRKAVGDENLRLAAGRYGEEATARYVNLVASGLGFRKGRA